ncbi:MAG: hypothetical protein VXX63_00550 [Bacteroidota bacterium]|nr:hypothetical protein [Bacteroidota bacterium]
MNKQILSKMAVLAGLVLLGFTSNGQTEDESYFDSSRLRGNPPPLIGECFSQGIKQTFVLHFREESALVLDLHEPPIYPMTVQSSNGTIISRINATSTVLALPKFSHYKVKSFNSCGDEVVLLEVSTTPVKIGGSFGLPQKLYDQLAINSTDGLERTILDYLSTNEVLNKVEKLYIIQNYYFGGDLAWAKLPLDTDEDIPTENGGGPFGHLTDSVRLHLPDGYRRLGDLVDTLVWSKPNRNCLCKATFPDALGDHSKIKTRHLRNPSDPNTFNWFEHKYTWGKHYWPSSKGNHKVWWWNDWNKGAMRKHEADIYMKRVGSDKAGTWKRPDASHAGSPYRTFLKYNLLCESKENQKDDCMCEDRVLYIGANYTTEINAGGGKLNCFMCGKGYGWQASGEDWAFLTKSSQKTGMGILDAGRLRVVAWDQVSPNKDWDRAWFDLAKNLLITGGDVVLRDSTAWADSGNIARVLNNLKTIATSKSVIGASGQAASANGALISGGVGTAGYSVKLLPNDPTWITIHSFASHHLTGHTKYEANVRINSYDWLAGFLDYKKTNECCTEEFFNWVIGVNDIAQNELALRQVNQFIKSNNPRLTPLFPNRFNLEFTGNNEFTIYNRYSNIGPGYQSSLCPPKYYSRYSMAIKGKTPKDTDKLPIGTQYQVANILDHTIVAQGVTKSSMTLGDLKNKVLQNGALRQGYYSLRIAFDNEVHHLKILKQ